MTTAASVYPPLEARPLKDNICLFDVDETLTPARRVRCDRVPCQMQATNISTSPTDSDPRNA